MASQVPFVRLAAGREPAVRLAVTRVLDSGRFVLGPEVEAFEASFAVAAGVRHVVGVASGTDAITLSLAAVGVGPGDRVLTTALSAGYTAVGIRRAGATPVFCDVDRPALGISPAGAAAKIAAGGIRAVVPVHLYGAAPAGFAELLRVAADHGVPVVEDACQAHGGRFGGKPLGSFGAAAAFSFYPTKNLGAVGDGGAVATDDADLAARVRRLRLGGQVRRHLHAGRGWNSRLDEIQAAALSARLPRLDDENRTRRQLARRMRERLAGLPLEVVAPPPGRTGESACHLFVVSTPRRDALRESLALAGVETLIHYPVPLPLQPAFRTPGAGPESFPEAVRASARILSLPLHPGLEEAEMDRIVGATRAFFRDGRVAE